MMNLEPANRAKRFYASTCPVCRELALEAFVSAQVVQFECGRCGGFGITAAARSKLGKRSEEERKEWLAHVRHQVSATGEIALLDAENGPGA
jgi:Zn ribbon nucleic-acid-binding protein